MSSPDGLINRPESKLEQEHSDDDTLSNSPPAATGGPPPASGTKRLSAKRTGRPASAQRPGASSPRGGSNADETKALLAKVSRQLEEAKATKPAPTAPVSTDMILAVAAITQGICDTMSKAMKEDREALLKQLAESKSESTAANADSLYNVSAASATTMSNHQKLLVNKAQDRAGFLSLSRGDLEVNKSMPRHEAQGRFFAVKEVDGVVVFCHPLAEVFNKCASNYEKMDHSELTSKFLKELTVLKGSDGTVDGYPVYTAAKNLEQMLILPARFRNKEWEYMLVGAAATLVKVVRGHLDVTRVDEMDLKCLMYMALSPFDEQGFLNVTHNWKNSTRECAVIEANIIALDKAIVNGTYMSLLLGVMPAKGVAQSAPDEKTAEIKALTSENKKLKKEVDTVKDTVSRLTKKLEKAEEVINQVSEAKLKYE